MLLNNVLINEIDTIKKYTSLKNKLKHQAISNYNNPELYEGTKTVNFEHITNVSEKQELYDSRRQMQKEIDRNKQKMMEQMEKVRLGKLDPEALAQEFAVSKPVVVHSNNNSKQENSIASKEPKKQQSETLPKPIKKTKEMSKAEAEKAYEDLKLRLDEEERRVLDEEQKKEDGRDEELGKIKEEKARKIKEKEHGFERAKAQKRIQDLFEKHEKELKEFRKKNKL